MATREEKLQLIEQLKNQIDVVKSELEYKKKQKSNERGSFWRTCIVVLLVAAGIGALILFL